MLSLAQIARDAQAELVGTNGSAAVRSGEADDWAARAERWNIEELLTDSRHLRRSDVCLFVAIKTEKNDGHRYIAELYNKGVRAFMVSQVPGEASTTPAGADSQASACFPDAVFLKTDNTLAALQRIAAAIRRRFTAPVVGITGSNGKTIVKEWLSDLLMPDFRVVKSPKSYNSQVGVPLSLWDIRPWHTMGIFEAGISQVGEMAALVRMIQPTIGIFTNVGAAHAAHFTDHAQKAAEKLQLFHGAETLIYSADDRWVSAAVAQDKALKSVRCLAWSARGQEGPAAPNIVLQLTHKEDIIRDGRRFTRLIARYQPGVGTTATTPSAKSAPAGGYHNIAAIAAAQANAEASIQQIEVPFTDAASLENIMHCWLFLLQAGISSQDIALRMARLSPVEMRMELKEGINHNYLINDAYNSDFDAFGLAVDYLLHQAQGRRKRIVLSDMLQSGQSEDQLYGTVADLLRRHKIEAMVGIGPQLTKHQALFSGIDAAFYPDTETFMQNFNPTLWHDEVILLKGARCFAFERIAHRLQKKVHETVMEIDMDAMIHNLNFFRSRLKPQTKIMIMAKAFSYGSGSYEVANAMAFHHSDYITVAYADEGVSLRQSGIELPIMVVNAEAGGLESVLQYRLEPEIYSFRMLDLLREHLAATAAPSAASTAAQSAASSQAMHGAGRETPPSVSHIDIHIKLDTGMHRLGFEEADLDRLLAVLSIEPRLRVRSIFTHLATADDPAMDAYTLAQLQRFDRMSAYLKDKLPYGNEVLRHALNTAGICRFPQYQYDMVRLGIGLYGVGVTAEMEGRLETVSTFKTTIAQIRHIAPGEAVGYGRRFVAEKPMKIGVLCVGYADGLNRRLSRGVGRVWIQGQTVPIIGNICMDMCMLDLTDVNANEGDEVILFGKEWPVTYMADALQTIPYEVLTGISPRVKRVYYQA